MENNWDAHSVERSEAADSCCSKENLMEQGMKSLNLKEYRKQGQQLQNVMSENVFKFKNEKTTLVPQFMPPQAYRYKDIYSSRKDQRIQKCLDQERKQREFHSRPMPNFRQVHERQALRTVEHRITMPVTPNVLRISLEQDLKRRQRELEQEREEHKQQMEKCWRAKPVPVSNRQPLKPANRQPSCSMVKVKPFNLVADKRVQQRRSFNIQNSQMQEMKRRELEEQRVQAEREANQKQRQLTTFRARPNPFASTTR